MKKILIVLLLFSALVACKKEDTAPLQLPDATTTGNNTSGWYADGTLYVADVYEDTRSFSRNNYYKLDGGRSLFGVFSPPIKYYFDLDINNNALGIIKLMIGEEPVQGKTYLFNTTTCPTPACLTFVNYASLSGKDGFYMTDESNTGSVTFTRADTSAFIFSGNFEFTAKNIASDKVVKITQGRFDYNQRQRGMYK